MMTNQTNQTNQTTLKVAGMTCGSCVRHVNLALRGLEGVSDVEVKLREGEVLVTHEDVSVDAMVQALREAGYELTRERP